MYAGNMSKATKGTYMPKGQHRIRVTVTIDPAVWKDFQALADSMGLSASRLAEISWKAQIAGKTQTITDVMKGIIKGFMDADEDLTVEQKMKMEDLIDGK